MGSVSLFEDIGDRLNDDAMNVVVARSNVTSIKHLPDGPGARSPRLRSEIAALWQEFEHAVRAVDACNRRPIATGRSTVCWCSGCLGVGSRDDKGGVSQVGSGLWRPLSPQICHCFRALAWRG